MFEFHKYDPSRHPGPVARPTQLPEQGAQVTHRTILLWAEHCSECAAPDCYRSCDLYDSRADGHCRRFAYGVYPNRSIEGLHGPGAEITFKRWGKLETVVNTRLVPARVADRNERRLERVARLLDRFGAFMFRHTGDCRWGHLTEAISARLARVLQRGASVREKPGSFLLRAYNPAPAATEINVQMAIDYRYPEIRRRTRPFAGRCTLPPGFSEHRIPLAAFEHLIDTEHPFVVALAPAADAEPTLVILAAGFVTLDRQAAVADTPAVKCVVFDLDGTLWDGILVEGQGVRLKQFVPAMLRALDERGILCSIASKNGRDSALAKLTELDLAEYFLYPQIQWTPKSQSIRTIAKQLNFGLDAIAFVDDSPFELDEVRAAIPEVRCIPAADLEGLLFRPDLQGSTSEEARSRRHLYQQQALREQLIAEAGGDYLGFLRSCRIRLDIDAYAPKHLDRASEIVQRTNQLNFSGRHYTRPELEAILENPTSEKYVLHSEDRYGSYGTVGLSIVLRSPGRIVIEDFMLSCRVQSKCIEQAFFRALRLSQQPVPELRIVFRATNRNALARQVLEQLGFQLLPDGSGYVLPPEAPLDCDFIDVVWKGSRQQPVSLAVLSVATGG